MLGGIFTWLLIGMVLYLLFSDRGGMMGCYGGHDHHSPQNPDRSSQHRSGFSTESDEDIIDLKKEDYTVISKQ